MAGRKRKLLDKDRFAAINAVARKVNTKSGGNGSVAGRADRRFARVLHCLEDLKLCSTEVKIDGKPKRREIRSDNPGMVINRVWSLLGDGVAPEVVLSHGEKTLRAERFGFEKEGIRALIFEDAVECEIAPEHVCMLFGYQPEHAPKVGTAVSALSQLRIQAKKPIRRVRTSASKSA